MFADNTTTGAAPAFNNPGGHEIIQHEINKKKPCTRRDLHERIVLSKMFIDSNLRSSLKLKDMAKTAYMSVFHYTRSFKELYHVTPYQYYLKKKLEAATELLMDSDASVTAIALNMGYNDIHCFSKLFRKAYNMCPSEYRIKYFQAIRGKTADPS